MKRVRRVVGNSALVLSIFSQQARGGDDWNMMFSIIGVYSSVASAWTLMKAEPARPY